MTRTVEIFIDGLWQPITIDLIVKGDRFRLIEPDGSFVTDEEGNSEWVAKADSFYSEIYKDHIVEIEV
jgi:hypothetical protein